MIFFLTILISYLFYSENITGEGEKGKGKETKRNETKRKGE